MTLKWSVALPFQWAPIKRPVVSNQPHSSVPPHCLRHYWGHTHSAFQAFPQSFAAVADFPYSGVLKLSGHLETLKKMSEIKPNDKTASKDPAEQDWAAAKAFFDSLKSNKPRPVSVSLSF